MKSNPISKITKNTKFKDSFFSILSSLILTGILQILVYPLFAKSLPIPKYGTLLTVMGIVNTLGASIGSTLNNTRLLIDNRYRKENLNGDFNYLFIVSFLITGILLLTILKLFFEFSSIQSVILVIVILLISFRSYYSVSYRLVINYKKVLIMNVFGALGYLIGLSLYYFTDEWPIVFLMGELSSSLYIFNTSSLYKESYKKTHLYKQTKSDFNLLLSSSVLGNAASYMDRFIIYPLIGGEGVSVYTVASMLGKTAGIIISPVTSVLLSYYVKEEKLSMQSFGKRVLINFLCCFLIFMGIVVVGKPVLGILYPDIIELASEYFLIANLAAIILIFGSTLQPMVYRFANLKWQPVIQVFYLTSYLLFSILGYYYFSFRGFIIGIMFANLIRAFFMIGVTFISIKRK